ncbi:Tripartite tricarboxylate transporter family receptor [compost metagenome]
MRRSISRFAHAALASAAVAATVVAAPAYALDSVKVMIGANPGGGYDQTGRSLGAALIAAGQAKTASYDNKGGAGGTIALTQFVNTDKGNPNALMVVGAVMVGAIETNKPPVTLKNATPIARLFADTMVITVPASSGGGEASASIMGGHVTVGIAGVSEFLPFIKSGKMRALAVTSKDRTADIPTLKEQGVNVEIYNWRGVYGAPGTTPEQRKAMIDAVVKATESKAWKDTLQKNDWTPFLLTGDEFGKFVDSESARLGGTLRELGVAK